MRDSDLIRKLLKSGLTYRAISIIAKCSHGSVHQEKLAMKREDEAARLKALEVAADVQAQTQDATVIFPEVSKTTPQ